MVASTQATFALCSLILFNIYQSQPTRVALETDQVAIKESVHSTNICVVVTMGAMITTASVTISTHGLSATAGDDFVGIFEQVLTLGPGVMRRCTNLTVIEDNVVEGDETLTAQIQSSMLLIGTPQIADITIMDTSRITIGLVSEVFPVTEGVQASVCAAIRYGRVSRNVEFTIEALTVGTASYGPGEADYIPSTVSLAFHPSTLINQSVCASFVIVDDNLPPTVAEDDEYFLVSLSTSDNADIIPEQTTARVVIRDNDGIHARLVLNTLTVIEGRPGESTPTNICLVLDDINDGLQRTVDFNLSIIPLNSASLNDFSPQHTTSITFPSGSMVNDRRCSEYRIIGDDIKEDSETFGLSISPVDSINTIVGNPSVFITIQDDGDVIQDCGPPPRVNNGYVDFNLTLNGSFATYTCNEGFNLAGPLNLSCLNDIAMIDGAWSDTPPVCNVIDCGVPPTTGNNSVVTYSDTSSGSRAMYSCTSDCYELDSDEDTLVCLSNESWSGHPPQCRLIECEPLQEIDGCVLSLPASTGCGSEAFYQALPGFKVDGDKNITCRDSGYWRGDKGFTVCPPSECQLLPDPTCGGVQLNSLSVGSTANISCDEGCRLSPNVSQIICLSNEQWSSPPPTCEAITCPLLNDTPNGTIVIDSTQPQLYGTVLKISCANGFRLEGSATRTCLSNGTWSGEETHCAFVECELVTPENGDYIVNGTGLGSTVKFSCILGYNLIGQPEQVCLENGTWSGSPVRCDLIDCQEPRTDNVTAYVNYSSTTFGSSANFTCPGSCNYNTSFCEENGKWTETNLNCFRCEQLLSPSNGVVTINGNLYPGSIATYVCDEGYILSAEANVRECTCVGWNSSDPACDGVEPTTQEPDGKSDVIIIVVATIGGTALLVALVVLVWVCTTRSSPKTSSLRRTKQKNYKGNASYVLPYTIYANRSSALEPLASNNRNSDLFDISDSLESNHVSPLRGDSGLIEFCALQSARGSEFGLKPTEGSTASTPTSVAERVRSKWDDEWAESSLSSETSDQNFNDDSSSYLTTSTIPMSEYQRSIGTADQHSGTKKPVSILKKK